MANFDVYCFYSKYYQICFYFTPIVKLSLSLSQSLTMSDREGADTIITRVLLRNLLFRKKMRRTDDPSDLCI